MLPSWWSDPHPFDLRFVEHPDALAAGRVRDPRQSYWVRAAAPMPDEPLLHAALLAYVCDLGLLDPALLPHGRSWYGHRRDRRGQHRSRDVVPPAGLAERVVAVRQSSPVATAGRALCTCSYTDVAGRRLATATQEGVLREP